MIPGILENAPHAKYVARKGEINAWDSPEFVAAVKATGKKTLIIAGTITSVCIAFPAISAVQDGHKVFAVVDCLGNLLENGPGDHAGARGAGRSHSDGHGRCHRRAAKTWHRDDAQEWAEIYTKLFPSYQLLIEC